MSTLHTINKSPSDNTLWQSCLAALLPGDALLMIENAAYAAAQPSVMTQLQEYDIDIYLLSADVDARGLSGKLYTNANIIDDQQFVTLACQHTKVVSWF
ncbi:sulfurtransferase complex subunit TusB [Neptunomonas antarctica]|uniref:tRNA 2-thiouridine synthesizing protein B n=1 Tax=Neptunomonas antarctica TaxID=619304 RepID=A0A1N7PIZ7_9GAMM|nr:sulfurtransferase complex subunit TusB [Neptunomonas antarctica]SIT10594.1 tRNA 2-thiouridine synthesizing protein B [Neptunomonas antarctica]